MKKYQKQILASIIFLLVVLLTGCGGDPVEQVLAAVDDYNYQEAADIYAEKIDGDLELENIIEEALKEKIDSVYALYNEGELAFDDANLLLDTIAKSGLYRDFDFEIINMGKAIEELKTSKDAFEMAEKLFAEKDYIAAYEQYCNVFKDDLNYAAAQTKMEEAKSYYLETIDSEIQSLLLENQYSDANNKIEEAMIIISNDTKLLNKQSEIQDLWKSYTLEEAKAAFGTNKNYEAAIQVLQKSELPTDLISSEIEYYQSYAPTSLSSLEYIKKASYVAIGTALDSIAMDVNKTVYNKENILYSSSYGLGSNHASNAEDGYITYYLNGEYQKLTGVLYRPYQSLSATEGYRVNSVFKVYGDDVLLYEAPQFTQSTYETQKFDINIKNVRELKIVILGVWQERTSWSGLYDFNPTICAANLMIQK